MAIIISFTFSLIITNLIFFFPQFSSALDTITQSHPLLDGDTLVSSDGTFELGFFTPGTTSTNRYVGIWYKNIPEKTVVWVANRENPTNEKSSMLAIDTEGNLVLATQNNSVLWSTNSTTTKTTTTTIVKLLDSGNLILRYEKDNDSDENYIWQSFDYPSDTFLPGMKIGWDLKKNLNRRLTAWKNWDDPSLGDFTFGFILTNNPEVVLWIGSTEFYRGGPFDGVRFNGAPSLEHNPIFDFEYVNNEKEVYFTYRVKNNSMKARLVMNQTIHSRQSLRWIAEERVWKMFYSVPVDYCDSYNLCGPFGNCAMDQSPLCHCLEGFEPKSKENWIMMDWTQGCVRSGNWSCGEKNKDGFLKFSNMKAPDTKKSWVNRSMNLEECRVKCLEDCNCSAYANTNMEGEGSGCAIWFGDLIDLRRISNAGQDVYIRVVASEIVGKSEDGRKKKVVIVVTTTVSFILLILLTLVYTYWIKRTREKITVKEEYEEDQQEDLELPFFDLATIACATNGFSSDKKLGEGGFGPVYRGTLSDGQEIAVKRLSRISSQGLDEFKNEVILCAKLQHRNLVKILGCCIQGEEKLLVYEFMPNKSLDYFLFDPFKSKLLNWPKRFNIICGVARGLLYLHQDSRLRIIHRDLKASNILLDNELNPKISDFGLARIFGADQVEGNYTNKVVGTYGYMAPEYAIDGLFSTKSDVFSFGVSLLEILSGKKNRGLSHPKKKENLVSYAWRLWKEGIPLELLDTCLGESYVVSQVLRCIHIGLLCVQQCPDDRPTMGFVVGMLTSESAMNQPKEPAFLMEKDSIIEEHSSSKQQPSSTNNISMSMLEAR